MGCFLFNLSQNYLKISVYTLTKPSIYDIVRGRENYRNNKIY